MRALLLGVVLAITSLPVGAQEIEWGEVPPDKAVLAVILPAFSGSYEITDDGPFADLIKANADKTIVKSYTVNPGIYSIVAKGAEPVEVKATAGAVQVVDYNPYKSHINWYDFTVAADSLKAAGASDWTWLGQQTFDPKKNFIFISGTPGTDDPGPMKPKG